MNLLPGDLPRRRHRGRTAIPGGAPAITGACILGASVAAAWLEFASLETRLASAATERDLLSGQISGREREEEQHAADRERLEALRAVERRLARWDEERFLLPELLHLLSLGAPDEVVLEEVRREGAEIWITGRASAPGAVAAAVRGWERLGRLEDLEILWVEQADDPSGAGGERFSLAGRVRYASRDPDPFEVVAPLEGPGG